MNVTALIGTKLDQKQAFLEDGTRIPVSLIDVSSNHITQIKTTEKEGYIALQMGFGTHKKAAKATQGVAKKAGLNDAPRFLREIRVADTEGAELGAHLAVDEVFAAGDIVNVAGTSKGKGYAGVVKRHGFKGGPRTHGQSDRERAPGSIGQSATPGRVYKGKRMAGHMGHERVTVRNLVVMDVVDGVLVVKGLIPGPKGTLIEVKKVGEMKKFMPLFKKIEDQPEAAEEAHVEAATEEAGTVEPTTEEVTVETVVEDVKEEKTEAAVEETVPVEEEKEEETK